MAGSNNRPSITDDQLRSAWLARDEKESARSFMRRYRVGHDRLHRVFGDTRPVQAGDPPETLPEASPTDLVGQVNEPPTVEWILAHHEVDLSQYRVVQVRFWTMQAKGGRVVHLYHIKLDPIADDRTVDLAEWFRQRLSGHEPRKFAYRAAPAVGDNILEISVPDAHIGRLCWGEETGRSHTTADACQMVREAYTALYRSVPTGAIGGVLLPVGNDLFNSDTIATTTTGGTHQDDAGVWQETFRAGVDTMIDIIEDLAVSLPVTVLVIPGNHDWQKCFYLGEILAAHFRKHARVTIDNGPSPRKYHRFGANLLGFTHGKHEKPARLPLIMAAEQAAEWSQCPYREWHLGHRHTQITNEDCGVLTRWLPSLAPADSWHHTNGYVGNRRAAKAYLYHRENGPVAEYTYQL